MNKKVILNIASNILLNLTPATLPIKIKPLLNNMIDTTDNFQIMTYQEYAKLHGFVLSSFKTSRIFGSNDGKIIYLLQENLYVLLYNCVQLKERKKWTIAHELGHFYCGHLDNLIQHTPNTEDASHQLNIELDVQANFFARALLAPPWVVVYIASVYKYNDCLAFYTICRSVFRLSKQASYIIAISTVDMLHSNKFNMLEPAWENIISLYYPYITNHIFNELPTINAFYLWTRCYQNEYNTIQYIDRQNELGTIPNGLQSLDQILANAAR